MAAPAEMLALALSDDLTDQQVLSMLEGLILPRRSEIFASAIVKTFLNDRMQARLACLERLESLVLDQVGLPWETSTSVPIKSIVRSSPKELVVDVETGCETLLFISRSGEIEAANPHPPRRSRATQGVTVTIPPGARAGWLALSTKKMQREAAKTRAILRKTWTAQNAEACLRYSPVDSELFAAPPHDYEASIPTPCAHWGVSIVALDLDQGLPGPLLAQRETHVTVSTDSFDAGIRVTLSVDGSDAIDLERNAPGQWTVSVPSEHVTVDSSWTARVFLAGRDDDPDDERTTRPHFARPTPIDHEVPPESKPVRRVVVLRPATIPRGTNASEEFLRVRAAYVQQIIEEQSVSSKWRFELEVLPWLDDDELAMSAPLDGPDLPASHALMQRLARLCSKTTGLEDVLLIAVVPRADDKHGFMSVFPSEAVAAMGLATEDRLADALRVDLPSSEPMTTRLRLVGRIEGDDVVLTEPVRLDRRKAGAGDAFFTSLVAVGFDAAGRVRVTKRVKTVSSTGSGTFTCLLPVDDLVQTVTLQHEPEVLAVELRSQPQTVAVHLERMGRGFVEHRRRRGFTALPMVNRSAGEPSVSNVRVDHTSAVLEWDYEHTRALTGWFEVELGRTSVRGQWVRVASYSAGRQVAPLASFKPGAGVDFDHVRVVAHASWATAHGEAEFQREAVPMRIRKAASWLYWLDIDDGDEHETRWAIHHSNAQPGDTPVLETQGAFIRVDEAHAGRVLKALHCGREVRLELPPRH
jgi:hypothetical protein